MAENFAESDDFHVTFGFFYMLESTTWDRRLYFPSEGRRAEDFLENYYLYKLQKFNEPSFDEN
jgi:hypothetical protein